MSLRPASASDLLIDGKLTAGSGGTFDIVNPATEEIIGQAADATAADMDAAIAAARNAFDETDWATNVELRVRGIRQLQQALRLVRRPARRHTALGRGRHRRRRPNRRRRAAPPARPRLTPHERRCRARYIADGRGATRPCTVQP